MNHYDVAVKLGFIIEDGNDLMASENHHMSEAVGKFVNVVDFKHLAMRWAGRLVVTAITANC